MGGGGGEAEPPARLSRGGCLHPRCIIAGSAGGRAGAGTALLTKGKADPPPPPPQAQAATVQAGPPPTTPKLPPHLPPASLQPRAKHFACAAEPQSGQAWPGAAGRAAAATAEPFGSGLLLRPPKHPPRRRPCRARGHPWAHRREGGRDGHPCPCPPHTGAVALNRFPPLQAWHSAGAALFFFFFFKLPSVSRRRFVA